MRLPWVLSPLHISVNCIAARHFQSQPVTECTTLIPVTVKWLFGSRGDQHDGMSCVCVWSKGILKRNVYSIHELTAIYSMGM